MNFVLLTLFDNTEVILNMDKVRHIKQVRDDLCNIYYMEGYEYTVKANLEDFVEWLDKCPMILSKGR